MNDARRPSRVGRNILALITGILGGIILTLGTDELLHLAGVFPAWGEPMSGALALLATSYRTVYNVAGSYMVARLAPNRPLRLALVSGFIGFALSAAGAIATWNSGLAPRWYSIAIVVLAIPCAWAGGYMRVRQIRSLTAVRKGVR
jgi:hypothetical protein